MRVPGGQNARGPPRQCARLLGVRASSSLRCRERAGPGQWLWAAQAQAHSPDPPNRTGSSPQPLLTTRMGPGSCVLSGHTKIQSPEASDPRPTHQHRPSLAAGQLWSEKPSRECLCHLDHTCAHCRRHSLDMHPAHSESRVPGCGGQSGWSPKPTGVGLSLPGWLWAEKRETRQSHHT